MCDYKVLTLSNNSSDIFLKEHANVLLLEQSHSNKGTLLAFGCTFQNPRLPPVADVVGWVAFGITVSP